MYVTGCSYPTTIEMAQVYYADHAERVGDPIIPTPRTNGMSTHSRYKVLFVCLSVYWRAKIIYYTRIQYTRYKVIALGRITLEL